jgi:hypothetical protein
MFTWFSMTHLPAVPDYFIQIAHQLVQESPSGDVDFANDITNLDEYKNRQLIRNGSEISSRRQRGLKMPPDWDTWVRENIIREYIETGVRISEGHGTVHGAHCDFRRKWKLYYLLDRGGTDAITVFYQQRGFPIVREEITDQDTELITCNDYQELIVVDRVQWPLNQWVLLNTMILHGVEGITGTRTNFTVSIRPDYNLLSKVSAEPCTAKRFLGG